MSNLPSNYRRRKTFLNVMNGGIGVTSARGAESVVGGALSQSHEFGTLGMVEDSQGMLRVAPSTILQGRLLNGISASRRSQQAQQTHIRYPKGASSTSVGNPALAANSSGTRIAAAHQRSNQNKRLQS